MRRLRTLATGIAALAACVRLGCAATATERQFIWDDANTHMAAAHTPEEFRAAAATYRQLLAAGVRNGPLFYNLGTALLKAGAYDEALQSLLRAERYLGSNPEIQRNMLLALSQGQKDKAATLPWYRTILFWHYGLSASTRMTVAALAFLVIWIALIIRRTARGKDLAGFLLTLSLTAFIVFGSSVATSVHEESKAEALGRLKAGEMPPGRPPGSPGP